MEAVPKLPMLDFEMKTSPQNTSFGPKLKQYISEAYREDPDSYSNEIYQLENLRASAVRPSIDEAGLAVMKRYLCQLKALQSRFPMSKGQPAACNFVWKDIYGSNCTVPDIRFEQASILYNIGAMHAQLGSSEPRTNAESLKSACIHFQSAAWAFQYLHEQYPQPQGMDVSTDIVRCLQEICFAQAQECILEKSIQDTKKPSVIGAVATQVLLFYKNSLALLGPSAGSDNIHDVIGSRLYNYFYRHLSFKASYIGCIVSLYQGMHAEEQQKMGERVAYFRQAAAKLAEARKLVKYIEPTQVAMEALTFTNDVVEGKKKAATNENEFIYHEEVPDKALLTDLKPVCLVKAIPINFSDSEVTGADIFARLVPMGAHEASSVYSEEKATLLRHIVAQVETKNKELAEFISSLQIDQLEVMDAEQRLPQEIVDRCAAMNAKTEIIQTLVDSMNNLAEIITDVEHSLADIKTLIQEETMKEKEYQKTMGSRPPSIVQTELSREFHKYQEAHLKTNESNQVLHKAMTLHIANLRLLAQPLEVLQAKIPCIENIEGLDRATMGETRRVLHRARDMRTQRDALLTSLRSAMADDDVTPVLLTRGNEDKGAIFDAEIEKHTPRINIIEQNLAAQEKILNKLTSLYASYGESRRILSDVLRKREGLINALITSYDTYEELLGKSQKGLEFYKKLSHNVNQLLSRLRSTCQVQEEERSQLLAKHAAKAAVPTTSAEVKSEIPTLPNIPTTAGYTPKLKDYLPYMKNRRNAPQVALEAADSYCPESMYPTSARPAPLGSEAADTSQVPLQDGVVSQTQHALYNRFGAAYASGEMDPYAPQSSYNFPPKPDDYRYGYNTPYTPPQYSHVTDPQSYTNPCYNTATQNTATAVTDSQIPYPATPSPANLNLNQYKQYDPYSNQVLENPTVSGYNPTDLNTNFANMQVSSPKPEGYAADYSQNYYMGQYSQAAASMGMYKPVISSNTNPGPMSIGQAHPGMGQMQIQPSNIPPQGQSGLNAAPQLPGPNMIQQPFQPELNTAPPQMQPGDMAQSQPRPEMNMVPQMQPNINMAPAPPSHTPQPDYNPYTANYHYLSAAPYGPAPDALTSRAPYGPAPDALTSRAPYGPAPDALTSRAPYGPAPDALTSPAPDGSLYFPAHSNAYDMTSQGTYIYTNTDSPLTSSTTVVSATTSFPNPEAFILPPEKDPHYVDPAVLAKLTALDQPIKSHVKGEALSTIPLQPTYHYDLSTATSYSSQSDQSTDQHVNFVHTYQNHPGYTYNTATGGYDYSYGSQVSYNSSHAGSPPPGQVGGERPGQVGGERPGLYTSAGACHTVQSPSETQEVLTQVHQPLNTHTYYNLPYGYQTVNQPEPVPKPEDEASSQGSANHSTYMQSGTLHDTSVTYAGNQVSSPTSDTSPPNFMQNENVNNQNVESNVSVTDSVSAETLKPYTLQEPEQEVPKPESKTEVSAFDLLSDIDFSMEQSPLMPEIKVPQISDNQVFKRPPVEAKVEPVPKAISKEEVIERPAKKDLFSDPNLLNTFTQEVKKLQKLVDSLTEKTFTGLTVLDSKWKTFQDVQINENARRSKLVATRHERGSVATQVVPYDDSRVTLKSDPDAYINASLYEQLAPWCIPIVISKNPSEDEYGTFWRAVIENNISCVVCLLSEIEMQGSFYWPTAIGQSLELPGGERVRLDEVTCTVHWTERRFSLATDAPGTHCVTHYQINVYPAKIVCAPLVLLADKILRHVQAGGCAAAGGSPASAWLQAGGGGGRAAALALLLAAMAQARAGQPGITDTLDAACVNLYKHRTNVLEDTKYLADAYRTVLFYAQGVICSGTTMFNGEAIASASGASVLPPAPPAAHKQKFSRESFEEMKLAPGLASSDMRDPLNFLDPLWSLKKK